MEPLEMHNVEIIHRGIEDFREVQDYMTLARKENAREGYHPSTSPAK